MAPMTNAERQAEYRRRLKARASLDALPEQAAKAADRAIEALWAFYSRPTSDGEQWANVADFPDLGAFKAYLVQCGELWEWCNGALSGWQELGATADEAAAWRTVVDATDALMAKPKPKAKPRKG